MELNDGEIERLERGLLVEHEEEPVIYTASFEER